jgi:23S rRNA pseudouridine1911/1915/1917 synthase
MADRPAGRNRADGRRLEILYEDRALIVVAKPAGMPTVPAPGGRERSAYGTLNSMLRRRGIREGAALVHRLDRDTSGVMLFARTGAAKKAMMDHWKNAVTHRIYVAVVEGRPPAVSGEIVSYLKENRAGVMFVTRNPSEGQRAVTRYRTLGAAGAFALLSLELETGRRNQIRVQLADIGCPVAGDAKYGGKKRRGEPTRSSGALALHALSISFIHPDTGREMTFGVPLPAEFLKAVGMRSLPDDFMP